MQSSKVTFIEVLRKEFSNPVVKYKCLESSLQKLRLNLVSRIFDDYPSLVTQEELVFITQEFQKLFEQIKGVRETREGFQLENPKDKIVLKNWEKMLANKACQNLLNANGRIKNEIVTFLGWEKYVDKINNRELIGAYVGTVNSLAMQNSTNIIHNNHTKYDAMCSTINKNCKLWIKEAMRDSGYPLDPERTPSSNDQTALGIGLGLTGGLLLTGLAIGGLLLFGKKAMAEDPNISQVFNPGGPKF